LSERLYFGVEVVVGLYEEKRVVKVVVERVSELPRSVRSDQREQEM
jgi:hypothetical protein